MIEIQINNSLNQKIQIISNRYGIHDKQRVIEFIVDTFAKRSYDLSRQFEKVKS